MNEEKGTWEKFCDSLDEHILECLEKGTPARLTLVGSTESVTIDIYRQKAQMTKFNDAILKTVKAQTGIDLVPKDSK